MRCITLIITLLSAITLPLHGQADISEELETIIKGSKIPSMVAAASIDGKIIASGFTGIRKHGDKTKVTLDDKYHIASCTKSMTATIGAMLVEQGKIRWNTKPSDVFKKIKIHPGYKDLTFEQLLTNTGGTPGDIEPELWGELWEARGSHREQRMQLVKGILSKEQSNPPGKEFEYSNAGFSIAGAMMEEITDTAYEELLTEMLFKPLGMESAGFRAPATNGKTDQPYGHTKKLLKVIADDPEPHGDNPAATAAAGAVHCSVNDLLKYANFHLEADSPLLSKAGFRKLHQATKIEDYAMGWLTMKRGWADGRVIMHNGTNTMFFTVMWLAPNKNFAAVVMCNSGAANAEKKCDDAISLMITKYLNQ